MSQAHTWEVIAPTYMEQRSLVGKLPYLPGTKYTFHEWTGRKCLLFQTLSALGFHTYIYLETPHFSLAVGDITQLLLIRTGITTSGMGEVGTARVLKNRFL